MYIDREEIKKHVKNVDVLTSVKLDMALEKLNCLLSQDEELNFWDEIIEATEEFLLIKENEVYEYIVKRLYDKKSIVE